MNSSLFKSGSQVFMSRHLAEVAPVAMIDAVTTLLERNKLKQSGIFIFLLLLFLLSLLFVLSRFSFILFYLFFDFNIYQNMAGTSGRTEDITNCTRFFTYDKT